MHLAIAEHARTPMIARLLLCVQADVNAITGERAALLNGQLAPQQATLASNDAGMQPQAVRLLLDEARERSNIAVGVLTEEEILGACFADTECNNIAFYTATTVGLYNVAQRHIFLKQRLTQMRVQAAVRGIAVNPAMGALAVFLEVFERDMTGNSAPQNLVIISPTGQLQQEESLTLSVESDPVEEGAPHPAVVCSTVNLSRLTLLVRLCSGKVVFWRLNATASQLASETSIVTRGGLIALAADGSWLAAVDREAGRIEVWSTERPAGGHDCVPKLVASLERRPACMAIATHPAKGCCLLALTDEVDNGTAPSPIEVLAVQLDGSSSSAYRIDLASPCYTLGFCGDSSDEVLFGCGDGSLVMRSLSTGYARTSRDCECHRSAIASLDRSLIVTASANSFRVFKAPAAEHAQ